MMQNRPTRPEPGRSRWGRSAMAGPSVIIRYRSDGGYLFVFRNDRAGCGADHGTGSPYQFVARRTMKPTVIAMPRSVSLRVRVAGSPVRRGANAYPAPI